MKSILVVDDERHVSRVTKLRLEQEGYRVDVASDGEEALEKLRAQTFDALITDVMMPRMGGQVLCERIGEEYPDRKFFIFVLTSSTESEHRVWAGEMPRTEFLEKPLSLRHLVDRLRFHLGDEPSAVES